MAKCGKGKRPGKQLSRLTMPPPPFIQSIYLTIGSIYSRRLKDEIKTSDVDKITLPRGKNTLRPRHPERPRVSALVGEALP